MRATARHSIAMVACALLAVSLFTGVAEAKKMNPAKPASSVYTMSGVVTAVDLANSRIGVVVINGKKLTPAARKRTQMLALAVDVMVRWQTPDGPMPATTADLAVGQRVTLCATAGKQRGRSVNTVRSVTSIVIYETPPPTYTW